jgi:hypothetical protein
VGLKTIATAEPSVAPPPMPIHLVEIGAFSGEPQKVALCRQPWDRLGRDDADRAPLCDGCADVHLARHGRRHPLDRRGS